MSEVVVFAVATPKPEHVEKFLELISAHAAFVQANEPDTLRYQVHRESNNDRIQIVVLETYKNQAAMDAHMTNEKFQAMVKEITEKGLLSQPLQIISTSPAAGFASR
ncbi:hypothetical protein IWX90DRAFT_411279 [Phyllosticta citrichinensis]|uniref:ABM domain-containing protein n=1 Tax=Phyllosticta citrichinensis TaxID=1130410 RepID=A0ABR1Y895_9PEZI